MITLRIAFIHQFVQRYLAILDDIKDETGKELCKIGFTKFRTTGNVKLLIELVGVMLFDCLVLVVTNLIGNIFTKFHTTGNVKLLIELSRCYV